MRRLALYLGLPPEERRLFRRALAVVGAIRLGLWVLPFDRLHRAVDRRSRAALHRTEREHRTVGPDRVVWVVQAAAARIPRATCLTRSLSAQLLLAQEGHPSTVHLGVAGGGDEPFRAHAWLTCEGADLGAAEGQAYAPITDFAIL